MEKQKIVIDISKCSGNIFDIQRVMFNGLKDKGEVEDSFYDFMSQKSYESALQHLLGFADLKVGSKVYKQEDYLQLATIMESR